MKNILTALFVCMGLMSAMAQVPNSANIPASQKYPITQNLLRQGGNGGGQRGVNQITIDYVALDDLRGPGNVLYTPWELNGNFRVNVPILSPADTFDNFTLRWAAVKFDSIVDTDNDVAYRKSSFNSMTIDTVYFYYNHIKTSPSSFNDTLIVTIYESANTATGLTFQPAGGGGVNNTNIIATNPVLWRDTIITNSSLNTSGAPFTVGALPVLTPLGGPVVVPQGKGFVTRIDYYGPKQDIFEIIDFNRYECGTNEGASPTPIPNSSRWFNLAFSSSQDFRGTGLLTLTTSPANCNNFYFQNIGIGAIVTIDAPLTAIATASALVSCPGQQVTLNAGASGGSGAPNRSYTWSGNGTFTSPNSATTNVILPAGNQIQTYTVTVVDNIENTTVTSSVNVTVRGITVDLGPDGTLNCGASRVLTPTTTGFLNGVTYAWSTNQTTQSITVTNPGTYVVTVTNSAGCTATDNIVLTSTTNQTVSFTATTSYNGGPEEPISQNRVCEGVEVNFTNTSNDLSNNWGFVWNFGDGSDTNTVDASYYYYFTGVYNVVLTANDGGCSLSSAPLSLQVLPSNHPLCDWGSTTLSVAISTGATTICAGNSTTLLATASGGTGVYNYNWSPAAGLSCTNCANPTANPTTNTTYTVTVTDAISTVTASRTIEVEAPQNPSISIAAAQSPVCFNQANTINVSVGGVPQGNYTLALFRNGSFFNSIQGLSYAVSANQFNAGDQLNVVVSANNACGSVSATSNTLLVGQCGTGALSLLLSPNTTICAGANTTLTAQGDGGSGNYTYSWTPATGLSCTNCASPTASPTATTTYTATVNDGQNTASGNITVTVVNTSVNAGNDVTICGSGSATLNANTTASIITWSPANGLSCTSCASPIATPQTTTTYTVTAVVQLPSGSFCISTDEVTVNVAASAAASVSITSSPSPACVGTGAITFVALPVNGGNPTYQWQLNGSNTGTNSPTLTLNGLAVNDVVTLSMTSDLSCVATPTVSSNSITVSSCVGIQEVLPALQFSVHPNPSAGLFYVNANGASNDEWTIGIFDLTGRQVATQTTVSTGLQQHPIDLTTVGKGVYIVRINNGTSQGYSRVVVY